jgi:hypothetical protein
LANDPISTVIVRSVCLSCPHAVLSRTGEAAMRALLDHSEFARADPGHAIFAEEARLRLAALERARHG